MIKNLILGGIRAAGLPLSAGRVVYSMVDVFLMPESAASLHGYDAARSLYQHQVHPFDLAAL